MLKSKMTLNSLWNLIVPKQKKFSKKNNVTTMESSKYESLIRVGKKPGHAVKASTKIQMDVL